MGRGRKVTGIMAATPQLRDRLSFLQRVSGGRLALLRVASSGLPWARAVLLLGPVGVAALRLLPGSASPPFPSDPSSPPRPPSPSSRVPPSPPPKAGGLHPVYVAWAAQASPAPGPLGTVRRPSGTRTGRARGDRVSGSFPGCRRPCRRRRVVSRVQEAPAGR